MNYLFSIIMPPLRGSKIQPLPIFYNHATPLGLKYLALNPVGMIGFFVQVTKIISDLVLTGKVANLYFIFIALLTGADSPPLPLLRGEFTCLSEQPTAKSGQPKAIFP